MLRDNKFIFAISEQAVVSISNLLLTMVISRIFGLDFLGQFVLALSLVQFFVTIQSSLIIFPVVSMKGFIGSTDHWILAASGIILSLIFTVFCCSVFWCILIFASDIIPDWAKALNSISTIIWIFAVMSHDCIRKFLIAKQETKVVFISNCLLFFSSILILTIGKFVGEKVSNLFSLLIPAYVFPYIIMTFYVWRRFDFNFFELVSLKFFSKVIRLGSWQGLSACQQWLSGNYLLIASAPILGTKIIGMIRLIQTTLGLFHIILQVLQNYMPSLISNILSESGKLKLRKELLKFSLITSMILLPTIFLILFYMDAFFEHLYLANLTISVGEMSWYVMYYICIFTTLWISLGLRSLEYTWPLMLATTLIAISSFIIGSSFDQSLLVGEYLFFNALLQFLNLIIIVYFFIKKSV